MDEADIRARLEEAIDVLADIEHDRWAHWQRYMHQKGERRSDGSLVLPAELVKKWDRQISTPFAELSEAEKNSDRDQVRQYVPAIGKILKG